MKLGNKQHTLSVELRLRDMILEGKLAAGERLYEVQLADALGVSRTPLRTALTRLELEGLLERRSTTGYVVRTFSVEDAIDATELRGVLEGTAARFAAERGVPEADLARAKDVLGRLERAVGECPKDLDFDLYVAANGEFHDLLAHMSQSRVIRRELERNSQLAFASPNAFLECQREIESFRVSLITAQAQHRAIIEAIGDREGSRAEAIAREHARLARRNLEYVMQHDRSLIGRVPGLALVRE